MNFLILSIDDKIYFLLSFIFLLFFFIDLLKNKNAEKIPILAFSVSYLCLIFAAGANKTIIAIILNICLFIVFISRLVSKSLIHKIEEIVTFLYNNMRLSITFWILINILLCILTSEYPFFYDHFIIYRKTMVFILPFFLFNGIINKDFQYGKVSQFFFVINLVICILLLNNIMVNLLFHVSLGLGLITISYAYTGEISANTSNAEAGNGEADADNPEISAGAQALTSIGENDVTVTNTELTESQSAISDSDCPDLDHDLVVSLIDWSDSQMHILRQHYHADFYDLPAKHGFFMCRSLKMDLGTYSFVSCDSSDEQRTLLRGYYKDMSRDILAKQFKILKLEKSLDNPNRAFGTPKLLNDQELAEMSEENHKTELLAEYNTRYDILRCLSLDVHVAENIFNAVERGLPTRDIKDHIYKDYCNFYLHVQPSNIILEDIPIKDEIEYVTEQIHNVQKQLDRYNEMFTIDMNRKFHHVDGWDGQVTPALRPLSPYSIVSHSDSE